jgi:hypothetical protein
VISPAKASSSSYSLESGYRFWQGLKIEAQKDFVRARHVADKAAQRLRQIFYQRRGGNDLLVPGQDRLLENVYHFKCVASVKIFLTERPDVQNCASGAWCRASDVKPQHVFIVRTDARLRGTFRMFF